MALQETLPAPAQRADVRRPFAPLGYAVLAVLVALWAYRAFHDNSARDSALAYVGGQIAWSTGHPEQWFSWTGTPFYAAVMAAISRVMSSATAARALTALNVVLVVGTLAVVLRRLRRVLPQVWWWVVALALATYAPMMSTVWWKQINVICLVLALGGFELLRRGRDHPGALVIAVSLALKPLAILVPFLLLVRRDTRRSGAWALGYLVALNIGAQVLIAAHAHDSSALNIWHAVKNFSDKSKPAFHLACAASNYSPQSLLCRLAGPGHWTVLQLLALGGVALLAIWILGALRTHKPLSWEVFALGCAISPIVSPIDWSHYQVMLAPLLVLLLVRFVCGGATVGEWAGLAVAFALASLSWSPFGSLIDTLQFNFSSAYRPNPYPLASAIAEFGQYIVIVTALLWAARRAREPASLQAPPESPR